MKQIIKKIKEISTKGLTKNLTHTFSILNGAKYFSSGKFQNYLLSIPEKKCIKYFNGSTQVDLWKSYWIYEENIENITKSETKLDQLNQIKLNFVENHVLADKNFNGNCLRSSIYAAKKVINLYISYTLFSVKKLKPKFYIR